jgi:hypothetical protein
MTSYDHFYLVSQLERGPSFEPADDSCPLEESNSARFRPAHRRSVTILGWFCAKTARLCERIAQRALRLPSLFACHCDTTKQEHLNPNRVAQTMRRQRPLPQYPLVAPPLRPSLPLRPCRASRTYAARRAPTPAAGDGPQRPSTAPNPVSLHQRAVLRRRGHDKRLRGTVGSCVKALTRRSYKSLTLRTTVYATRNSLLLMV